jgi:single-strand DNA-binding protein
MGHKKNNESFGQIKIKIMNTLKNKVSLIGRIGKTPEKQLVGTNKNYILTSFPLAVNDKYKDKNGQWHENTHWYNLTAWGKTAERISEILKKGQEIMIEGKMINKIYEKDGEKRYSTDIEVTEFLVLSRNFSSKNEFSSNSTEE